MAEIEVDGGTVEFIPSPDHVNLIATEHPEVVELRLTDAERQTLVTGLREDAETNVELEDGIVAWEPARGLYVEDFANTSFYLTLSPEQRATVAETLNETQVGT